MLKVLHVLNCMGIGGIETFLMNLYNEIDKSQIQFDFLLHRKTNSIYEKKILEMGGKIYYIPTRRDGYFAAKNAINDFFRTHDEYKIVHQHVSSLSDIDALVFAKQNLIPMRILHAHSTAAPGNKIHAYLHKLNKGKVKKYANVFYSCSDAATHWLFDGTGVADQVQFIPNGIDCNKFCFDEKLRDKYRIELNLKNKDVLIHVGRLAPEKNHVFLLEVFNEYRKRNPNSELLLVGDGPLRESIEEEIEKMGISNSVKMLGIREDVSELLQASDVFLLPSRFEGYPVSIIEAQATGIPCIYSDSITNSASITAHTIQLPIDKPEEWVNQIERFVRVGHVPDDHKLIVNSDYNISNIAKRIVSKYYTVQDGCDDDIYKKV